MNLKKISIFKDSNSLTKHHNHHHSKCIKLDTHALEKHFDIDAFKHLDKEELNERHLWLLTNTYDNLDEWKMLAVRLGLTKQDIDVIEFSYSSSFDGLRECFYQCLLKWRLIQPENCYFTFLCKIIQTKFEKTKEFIENLAQVMFVKERSESRDRECKQILSTYLETLSSKHPNSHSFNLNLKLDEKHLWSASELICLEWKSIARCLGLNESDLTDIYMRYARFEGMCECCYQMLLLWSQFYSRNANLEYLCLSLIEMRFNLFAKKLLEQCLC